MLVAGTWDTQITSTELMILIPRDIPAVQPFINDQWIDHHYSVKFQLTSHLLDEKKLSTDRFVHFPSLKTNPLRKRSPRQPITSRVLASQKLSNQVLIEFGLKCRSTSPQLIMNGINRKPTGKELRNGVLRVGFQDDERNHSSVLWWCLLRRAGALFVVAPGSGVCWHFSRRSAR